MGRAGSSATTGPLSSTSSSGGAGGAHAAGGGPRCPQGGSLPWAGTPGVAWCWSLLVGPWPCPPWPS
eukprot:4863203-Alexandrium_andersonii.AAC.1